MEEELKQIMEPYIMEKELLANLTPETKLIDDLKINSAHVVDIVLDIEEKYDIEIDNDSIMGMETVGSALEVVQQKLDEKK